MEVNKYPALAAFILRLIALAMFIAGVGAMAYWLFFMRLVDGEATLAEAGVWQMALINGGFLLVGGVVLFALSRPLGRLIGYGL